MKLRIRCRARLALIATACAIGLAYADAAAPETDPVPTSDRPGDARADYGSWAVDPTAAGPDLPALGRSLFDHLATESIAGSKVYHVPFPFYALIDRIQARLGQQEYSGGTRAVMIPMGRSLQRAAAAPDFFRYPRIVFAVTGEPAADARDAGMFLKDRLYLGYVEKTGMLEAASGHQGPARRSRRLEERIGRPGDPRYAAGAVSALAEGSGSIVASTIDNDLCGTEITIGATTAIDVALEAIDRLRVTAASLHRAFLVEVMGRLSGHLALMAGIAGGAETIVMPELATDPETVALQLREAYARGKSHAIAVVAEGAKHNAEALARYFKEHGERLGFDLRVTKLGHIQRGGTPGVFDRMLGTLLGAAAADAAAEGRSGILLGMREGKVAPTALAEVAGQMQAADIRLFDLARVLAA